MRRSCALAHKKVYTINENPMSSPGITPAMKISATDTFMTRQ